MQLCTYTAVLNQQSRLLSGTLDEQECWHAMPAALKLFGFLSGLPAMSHPAHAAAGMIAAATVHGSLWLEAICSCVANGLPFAKAWLLLQGGQGVPEKRLQWALRRLSSLEGRVLQLESSAAAR